jgi:hypothetical protein
MKADIPEYLISVIRASLARDIEAHITDKAIYDALTLFTELEEVLRKRSNRTVSDETKAKMSKIQRSRRKKEQALSQLIADPIRLQNGELK